MKKRLMPMLLALLTAFICLVFTANADELTPSEGLKFTEYSTYFGVSGIGSCTDTDIVIPAEHNGKPVTSIEARAFERNTGLTSVVIPDTVTKIERYAFKECTALTAVTIGGGVESIGVHAFSECRALTEIDLPSSVRTIADFAFYDCKGLEIVRIGSGIESIGKYAFYGCEDSDVYYLGTAENWASVEVGESVIGDSAFFGCRNLEKAYFIGTDREWRSLKGYAESGILTNVLECKPLKDYSFKGATVTTAGYLIANYYLRIDNVSDLDDIAVRFTRNGVSTTVYGSEAVDGSEMINDGNTYYCFSYEVPAKNMGDVITAEIISTYVDAVHDVKDDYSIKTYYMNKLADGSDKMKAVSVAALNYGAAAQVYFGYDTDHLVNEGLTEEQKSLDAAPETPYTSWNKYAKFGELSNVSALGSTLVFKSDTRIRFYFTVTDDSGAIVTDDVSDYTFAWGTTEMTPVYSPSYEAWYVEASGIAAKSLDTAQIVTVSNGHGSLSVAYSPTTYVFNKYDSTTPGMADLVRSMYLYYIAAYNYAKK